MRDIEQVIGLEVHVQLKTESKIFCACPTRFGAEPNQNTCPICLGLPGSLPVLNALALDLAIKTGLALNCEISARIKFDRKNYFYPDLPKAYQISQYDMPVARNGHLTVEVSETGQALREKKIRITRAHLEEDAGKLLHEGIKDASWVDYNRAGVPLLEIVSEPDLRSSQEAFHYLAGLKSILQYLDVSNCNMEEGSIRCDANVSVRPKGDSKLGTKVEIKNMNSFRGVQRALDYEFKRQTGMLERGERIEQETRLWNEAKGETQGMRSKEYAHDYRYFPEPDLVPFSVSQKKISELKASLPELPRARIRRFLTDYGLSEYDAYVLVSDKSLGDYFEACVKEKANPKLASNWIQSELLGELNSRGLALSESKVPAQNLAGLIRLIENGTVSGKIAKEILPLMFETGSAAEMIVKEKGLIQMSDSKLLEELADRVIKAHPKPAHDVKTGKREALGFLVGQMMKETKGKANPKLINEILVRKLSS
ncbi:MAG: aspartyl/glutamyl-tRNA amidotransferase subunit B [Omnitrophica bacterium RIFCSPLOWO2_01_FULL_50_24]|nr:MAG: aspartyl/glutamyl-tRNA amidotransferase subunit B [Omnitrophica bacterium RIFCSPLOWO2_01_FULL_50_24]